MPVKRLFTLRFTALCTVRFTCAAKLSHSKHNSCTDFEQSENAAKPRTEAGATPPHDTLRFTERRGVAPASVREPTSGLNKQASANSVTGIPVHRFKGCPGQPGFLRSPDSIIFLLFPF